MLIHPQSRRFAPRYEHNLPERSVRIPRVTRRIELVHGRSGPRSGPFGMLASEARR